MATTTRGALQQAIRQWLDRGDLSDSVLDQFIELTETRLHRQLRTWQMQEQLSSTASSANVALPSDFLELIDVRLDQTEDTKLQFLGPKAATCYDEGANGQPWAFTIRDGKIELVPPPDQSYVVKIDYYEEIPSIASGSAGATNWLIAQAPDIYLWGAVAEGKDYLMDAAGRDHYWQRQQMAIEELKSNDRDAQWGGDVLVERPFW